MSDLSHIETPETDESTRTTDWLSGEPVVEAKRAQDLERRLTVAREALWKIRHACLYMNQAENIAEKALTQTAPKP